MGSQSICSKRMRETQISLHREILYRQHLYSQMNAEWSFNILHFMASSFINLQSTSPCRVVATNHSNSVTKRTTSIFKTLLTNRRSLSSSRWNSFLYTTMKTAIIQVTTTIYNNSSSSSSKWRSRWQRGWEIGFVLHAKTSIFHSERSATGANRTGSKISNSLLLKSTTSRCLLALMQCPFPMITCRICSQCNLSNNKFFSIILHLLPLKFSSTSTSNQFSSLEFKSPPNSSPQPRPSCLMLTSETVTLGSEWENS